MTRRAGRDRIAEGARGSSIQAIDEERVSELRRRRSKLEQSAISEGDILPTGLHGRGIVAGDLHREELTLEGDHLGQVCEGQSLQPLSQGGKIRGKREVHERLMVLVEASERVALDLAGREDGLRR